MALASAAPTRLTGPSYRSSACTIRSTTLMGYRLKPPSLQPASHLLHRPCKAPLNLRATGDDGQNSTWDLSHVEAMAEALELFRNANSLAHLQTQYELEQAWAADLERTASSTGPSGPSTDSALCAFWVEQGLSQSSAERLVREARQAGHAHSTQQLSAIVARWQRVLPGHDVVELIFRDSRMLTADVSMAIRNMVVLVEVFPGRDMFSVLRRTPSLLWCEDLVERAERVLSRLTRLHPSGDRNVVAAVVAENPALMFRMDYYPNVTLLDELPIEIQNMFVLADQGLGFLHRYYKRQKQGDYGSDSGSDSNFPDQEPGL